MLAYKATNPLRVVFVKITWVRFALRGSCRSSSRSTHGYTQRWEEAPLGRIQVEVDHSEQYTHVVLSMSLMVSTMVVTLNCSDLMLGKAYFIKV